VTGEGDAYRRSRWRTALGLGVVSALQLGIEILFIKLSRYQFGTLSLGVIGLAMLGVALAGPLSTALGGNARAIRRSTLALAPAALLAGAVMFALPGRWIGTGETNRLIVFCGLACLIPLALSSVPVFASMRRERRSVHVYYAASLAGATLGAPLAFGLLHLAGDLVAYVAVLGLSVPAVLLLVERARERTRGTAGAVLVVALAGVLLPGIDGFVHSSSVFARTNAFSRIDVLSRPDGGFWIRTAGVNAGTGLPGGTVESPAKKLMEELSARAFASRPRRVLILGGGAGRNVVQALAMGVEEVVAVDINGMIPEYMEAALPAEQDPYRDPRVRLVVAEGREAASKLGLAIRNGEEEPFDLVYVPISTLFGSSGHAFTQTYLMTREAMAGYLELLAPGGRVAAFAVDSFRSKVVLATARALADWGVEAPHDHLAVLHRGHTFLVIGRPDALAGPEEGVFASDTELRDERLDSLEEIALGERVPALTDDNPFLRNHILAVDGGASMFGWKLAFMRDAFRIAALLLVVGAAIGTGRALPEARIRRGAFLAAFAAMGIAYTAYQTVVIQRLAFLVGHPLLATAIVLPSTLMATAAGSYWSGRFAEASLARVRLVTTVGLLTFVAALAIVAPGQFLLPGWPSAARVAVAIGIAFPPFLVMGTYFPVVFARAEAEDSKALVYGWLLNGIGAVVGSVLAIYGSTMFGFSSMFGVAIGLYLSLSCWDVSSRGRAGRVADFGLIAVLSLLLLLGLAALEIAVVARTSL
jgi:hypothetical protein